MTVWIYLNTAKEVGDEDHLKVFATEERPTAGSPKTIRKAWPLSLLR
jgi:hypothetical protein